MYCKMLRKIWFYLFMETSILYSKTVIANPIIGNAYPAKADEFPFIVSLSHSNNVTDKEHHFCVGALISKRLVLTAEHCIRDRMVSHDVMVVVGSINLNSGQIYRVKSWITFDLWALSVNHISQAAKNDIAILTLSQDVENIEPAKISALHDYEVLGRDVVIAGWGVTDKDNDIVPDSLLKANLKVLTADLAKKYHRKLYGKAVKPEPFYYYTSADPPAVLGSGDSGGPLLLADSKEIVGINQACCNIKNLHKNQYAMSRHLKLSDEYKEFIEDMKTL